MADTLSSNPWHAIFAFLIPIIGMVVQMHFSNSSPMDSHPPNMWIFIVCLFIYCFAFAYNLKCQIYSPPTDTPHFKLSSNTALVSGSMATAALISVLVSYSLLPLIIILYFILLLIYFAPSPVRRTLKDIGSYVYNMCKGTESSHDSTVNIQA